MLVCAVGVVNRAQASEWANKRVTVEEEEETSRFSECARVPAMYLCICKLFAPQWASR